ncbi:hypothetical protein PENTCL1PPCAC_16251 [Pristionchus entomophagus]|uniref:G protein-coupled receptor n=1 Tax=Pristionchus entomophagus TaxID=358040 RepID=A0AAV5TIE3_9BILA|nr:hypothetical protein PENTCL1PPCAC_16251 [Pristionchus entomophagus]
MLIPVLFQKHYLLTVTIVSLFGNGLLLVLIRRNGHALGNYRILLILFAIMDIFISAFHAWSVPMCVLGKHGYIVFGLTIASGSGFLPSITAASYSVTYFLPSALLVMHFLYRLFSLTRPARVTNTFPSFMLASVSYLAIFISSMYILMFRLTRKTVPLQYYDILGEYGFELSNHAINTITVQYLDESMRPNVHAMGSIILGSLIIFQIIFTSLVCARKIHTALTMRVLEIRSRRLHLQLFWALIGQFSIPALFTIIPFSIIIALPLSGASLVQTGNICCMIASVFPALDPLLMIVSISRFRSTITDWAYAIIGGTARRNEMKARERSRIYAATIQKSTTQTA